MTNAAWMYRWLATFMWALLSVLTPSYVLGSISHRASIPFPERAQHAAQHNATGNQRGDDLTSNPNPIRCVGARDVGKAAAARRWVGASPHLGMPKELIDGAGTLAWAAAHSAYGAVIASENDDRAVESPFRLLGQVNDPNAELAWTRFRCFDADTGTWISTDPLEIAGGANLYALDGAPSRVSDPLGLAVKKQGHDHEELPDDALVVRGGTCTAETFRNGSGVTEGSDGKLSGVSTQSKPGASVDTLAQPAMNNQVGVTTVGQIRAAGGTVEADGTPDNPNHATVSGLTAEQAEELFKPQPNPVPKAQRGLRR